MRDSIIMLTAIIAIFGIIGFMNASDVQACVERGHSLATCEHSVNR